MSNDHLGRAVGADNAETRCPVVLLLDTSGSMDGPPIDELNEGLQLLETQLKADTLVRRRVELAIITFGGTVNALNARTGFGTVPFDHDQVFTEVDQFQAPRLMADGETPMGEAVRRALLLVRQRKDFYKSQALDYYRPWVFLITDGYPNDHGWESAADQAKQEEARKGVTFFAIGVSGADMGTLGRFSNRRPMMLNGLAFSDLFDWLSSSLSVVSGSAPGDQLALPPVDWGTIQS